MSSNKGMQIGLGLIIAVSLVIIVIHRHSQSKSSTGLVKQGSTQQSTGVPTVRYLALGDSYTIGESVNESERWPNQLVARLQHDGVSIGIVGNPSVTGYTTQNLIDRELPLLKTTKPNFVTILIGVNDYVQGVSADKFQTNLKYILDTVQAALPDPSKVVLVTIPDYGKTPTGAQYGKPADSEIGIKNFNAIIVAAAQARNLPLADVFPASQQVTSDPSLIAPDGLHPSGKQYALWTDAIYPVTKPLLGPAIETNQTR